MIASPEYTAGPIRQPDFKRATQYKHPLNVGGGMQIHTLARRRVARLNAAARKHLGQEQPGLGLCQRNLLLSKQRPITVGPTFMEQGVDFSYHLWIGLMAPAGKPKPIVDKLNEALVFALSQKEIQDRYASEGADAPTMSADEFTRFMASEVQGMQKLIDELKVPKQ